MSPNTSLPEMMKAAVMHEHGESDVLKYEDFPVAHPKSGEVLIRIGAATVNHTDIFHRKGQFIIQKDLPHILGMDVAGQIVEIGSDVTGWKPGDRVVATFEALGRERNGAYAEFTTLPVNQLQKIPDNLDYVTAASIGLAFTTAWIALFYTGNLSSGKYVVIHAASSGVGTSALQIARWKGSKVIAISDLNKADKLYELGASHVVDRKSTTLVDEVMAATNNEGAAFVLDLVGKTTLQSSIQMISKRGEIVCVGTLSGDIAEINIMDLIMKAGSIKGSFGVIKTDDFQEILKLFADGIFKPVIDCVLPLREAVKAHHRIEAGKAFGKIILDPQLR